MFGIAWYLFCNIFNHKEKMMKIIDFDKSIINYIKSNTELQIKIRSDNNAH